VMSSSEGAEKQVVLLRKEINFLKYPYFAIHTKGLKKKHRLEFRQVFENNGRKIETCWTVIAHPDYGFPGPFDRRVNMAVEYIASRMSLPITNPIRLGSWYEFCRLLGVRPDQWHYREINNAIRRMVMTGIESKHAFYSRGKKKWINEVFHLYNYYVQKGDVLDDGSVADTNYLYLNSWYIDNLNARYAKLLDYDYYRSLGPIASRLYEILGLKFYRVFKDSHINCIQYRYLTLSQLLPVSRRVHISHARQQLSPAHKELLDTKFLAKIEWAPVPHFRNDWYVTYHPGERCREEMSRFADAWTVPPEPVALTEAGAVDVDADEPARPADGEQSRDESTAQPGSGASTPQAGSDTGKAGGGSAEADIPQNDPGDSAAPLPVQEKLFPEAEDEGSAAQHSGREKSASSKKNTKKTSKETSSSPYSKEFLRFWEAYPVKVGKAYCWKVWKKTAKERPGTKSILSAIEAQKKHKKELRERGEFCAPWPHPSTWLNQGRWEDEVAPMPHYTSDECPPYYRKLNDHKEARP